MDPVCILGAVGAEISGIRGELRQATKDSLLSGRLKLWRGSWVGGLPVVLAQTGVGAERALAAIEEIHRHHNFRLLVSCGYAGGLDPKLAVGDVILAGRILQAPFQAGSNAPELPLAQEIPYALPETLAKCVDGIARGTLLTVGEVIFKPEHKQRLRQDYGADAVEMETAPLAEWSGRNKTDFLALRAVSDTAEHELVDLSRMEAESGEVSPLKAGWYALTHPGSIKDLVALGVNAKKATRHLTEQLRRILSVWANGQI